mmetsp:Transcript_107859/g.185973  ORF Transcript_107859/g.185973 Transcript_107859/m.185973 type:complete len:539 (-) Transcript_107859:2188-3804(-)
MATPIVLTNFAWCKIPPTRPYPNYLQLGDTHDEQGKVKIEIKGSEELRQLKLGAVWSKYAAAALISQPIDCPLMQSIQKTLKDINLHRPLSGTTATQIYEKYHNEYDLEVNEDVCVKNDTPEMSMLITGGVITGGGHCQIRSEIADLKSTLDYVASSNVSLSHVMQSGETLLSYVKDLHSRLLKSQASRRDFLAGEWRNENVCLPKSDWATPQFHELPALMLSFAEWACTQYKNMEPVHFSVEVHCRFVYLHPFADGNGRVARLLMNLLLSEAGYPPIMISKQDKHRYCSALERGFWGYKHDYYSFMLNCLKESMDIYVAVLTKSKSVAIPLEKQHNLWSMSSLDSYGGSSDCHSFPSIGGSPLDNLASLLSPVGDNSFSRFNWPGSGLSGQSAGEASPLSPCGQSPNGSSRRSSLLRAALMGPGCPAGPSGKTVRNSPLDADPLLEEIAMLEPSCETSQARSASPESMSVLLDPTPLCGRSPFYKANVFKETDFCPSLVNGDRDHIYAEDSSASDSCCQEVPGAHYDPGVSRRTLIH